METGKNSDGIGLTIGRILGYITIFIGLIMTFLLLEKIILGR